MFAMSAVRPASVRLMDVSIVIPVQASELDLLPASLGGVFAQRYDAGRIEVFVVQKVAPVTASTSRPIRKPPVK